jgi:hypothetical protein
VDGLDPLCQVSFYPVPLCRKAVRLGQCFGACPKFMPLLLWGRSVKVMRYSRLEEHQDYRGLAIAMRAAQFLPGFINSLRSLLLFRVRRGNHAKFRCHAIWTRS